MFFGVDETQTELYAPENRESVEFNFFKESKMTLQNLEGKYFFQHSIIYDLMYKTLDGKEKPRPKIAKEIFGEKIYEELPEIKEEIKLDRSVFGFFNKCFLVNQLLSRYEYFLKFFERRDKFCYLITKRLL